MLGHSVVKTQTGEVGMCGDLVFKDEPVFRGEQGELSAPLVNSL